MNNGLKRLKANTPAPAFCRCPQNWVVGSIYHYGTCDVNCTGQKKLKEFMPGAFLVSCCVKDCIYNDKTKTIEDWSKEYGIEMMDPDGFDRKDPELFNRKFTREQFNKAVGRCTIQVIDNKKWLSMYKMR